MPSNLLTADILFPHLDQTESDSKKIEKVTNYLYMLLEQLRYTLGNLGVENFNKTEIENFANLIIEPVHIQLQDEDGKTNYVQITSKNIAAILADQTGAMTSLTASVNGINTAVSNLSGDLTEISQWASGIELSASTSGNSSTISITPYGATIASTATIRFTGFVTFEDLEESGETTINGDNITTGTITGCTFNINFDGSETTGDINMYDVSSPYRTLLVGNISMDNEGAGDDYESQNRIFFQTHNDRALKLHGDGGISMTANRSIYIAAGNTEYADYRYITLACEKIYLRGDIHLQGNVYDADGNRITFS